METPKPVTVQVDRLATGDERDIAHRIASALSAPRISLDPEHASTTDVIAYEHSYGIVLNILRSVEISKPVATERGRDMAWGIWRALVDERIICREDGDTVVGCILNYLRARPLEESEARIAALESQKAALRAAMLEMQAAVEIICTPK